jgi:hypothetical protein
MAHERFADFLVRQNNETEAKFHYNEALRLYEDWGAIAKVSILRAVHHTHLCPPVEITLVAFTDDMISSRELNQVGN